LSHSGAASTSLHEFTLCECCIVQQSLPRT
jgi:hypothetical protein